ncbi:ATP binding microtubule motor family protein [Heracleum sosnowskyi]|uniref:ATP binding microtubule motor family protein n=1 Tax=Heracleum sosnowskyi TaxID=360622 RepID=A0AAD8IV96_9APIA|nr:ATP binding microtubule motor family protein [Heracleum sosnowskyi]
MSPPTSRLEKVKKIFKIFDVNRDGGLNREEMAALVVAVNPRVKFSDEQINAILDEVFKTYNQFIDGNNGLTHVGLLKTYDDGAGDVDRDFDALGLYLNDDDGEECEHESVNVNDEEMVVESVKKLRGADHEIVYDDTWKIVDKLEVLVKRLKESKGNDGVPKGRNFSFDGFSDNGWFRDVGVSTEICEKRVNWEECGSGYDVFVKELGELRGRVDGGKSRSEAFDGHMAMGRVLYENRLFKDGYVSFKRACELEPADVRAHFRAGNCLYVVGKRREAKDEFLVALEAAEGRGNEWGYMLPQIHVNLGIVLEGEGLVIAACEHYREAAILCPTHFRALKLLGSALFGVGEYKAAVKALEEAIYMKHDYADAHCDLASALHGLGDDENAIKEFQKAIDLKPGHMDALYNLGGLYMDIHRYQRACEMYTRVLGVWPNHWRAQLNKAVSLLGAGETEDAKKALKEALKMTNRVELHDAIAHINLLQKKKLKGNGAGNMEESFVTVEPSKFKMVGKNTTSSKELASVIDVRSFQRVTRLSCCDVDLIKKEMKISYAPAFYSSSGVPGKPIRKASLEEILCRLLSFLKPETFVGAVKAINQKILSVLDETESGRVDLGMFFAVIAPMCSGPAERRKRVAFDALAWRSVNQYSTQIKKVDALSYIKVLRAIYMSSYGVDEMLEIHGEADFSLISLTEFIKMFDDTDRGFGIMSTLLKHETGDRNRHGKHACAICRYPIIGSRFKEMKSHFTLCSKCYSEGKVPPNSKKEEYRFKEYASESDSMKDRCLCFRVHSKASSPVDPP